MTFALGLTAAFGVALLALLGVRHWLDGLPNKRKKALLKKTVNSVFEWFEDRGLLARNPAFERDYLSVYPDLRLLEANHKVIQEECMQLLRIKDRLTDIQALGGSYTQAGIHTIDWKVFVFKSGTFIDGNCERCPRTAELLREIPSLEMAFFSILDPHQTVTPHWGYYKGILRYHLGVIIPHDNEDHSCQLRVNGDAPRGAGDARQLIEDGESYYWKNGEGIVFDDNYLHDARNESDELRVILWLDLRRPMPFYLDWFNRLCLYIAHRDQSLARIQENARIRS